MNNSETKPTFKFFHKPAKGKMGGLVIVFLWIAIWNIIYQAVHGLWAESPIQIVNWAFFIATTLFFMQEELTYKQRFWHTLIGGSIGLLLAAGIGIACTAMIKNGVSHLTAVAVPLVLAIGILILLSPYIPVVFNNVGFVYLIVAFVESDKVVSMLPSYLVSLLLGSIILNLGCSFLISIYTKILTKKATEKMKKQESLKV